VTGYLTDRLGGRPVLLVGLFGSIVVCTLVGFVGLSYFLSPGMGTSAVFGLLLTLHSINRLFQASAWAAILKILSQFYQEGHIARVVGLFALSYGFGDALIRLILGSILSASQSQWWIVWFSAAGFAFFIWIFAYLHVKARPSREEKVILSASTEVRQSTAQPTAAASWHFLRELIKHPDFWIPVIMYIGMTFVRETVLSWTSVILADVYRAADGTAGTLSLVVPLFGAVAALLGGFVTDKIDKKWHIWGMCAHMSMLIVSLTSLVIQLRSPFPDIVLGLGLISAIAFFLEGPYTFIDGVYSLKMGGKSSGGVIVGVVQALGYCGGIAAGSLTGGIVDSLGWAALFQVLLGVIGFVLLLTLILGYITSKKLVQQV
jgi:sugar phosphate permease